jgi:ATP-dependent Lhr-like helicase
MIRRVTKRHSKAEVLGLMLPLVREWFGSKFEKLTEPQAFAVPVIHARKSVLISSPTGSGKTLTAFLSIINELLAKQEKGELEDRIYCVYVSPLKALANDIDKNLKQPLAELEALASKKGYTPPMIRVGVRSGDTTQAERQKMAKKPPHIFITTPESLAIVLSTPKFSQYLSSVEWVIMDEIHEVCSSKRGVLLSVSLERLQSRLSGKASRIGLSATQAPIEEMAKFLAGFQNGKPRDVNIVEVASGKKIELRVMTPVEDMTALPFEIVNARMYETLKETIDQNTTTLVFTNTRSGTEHVMLRLAELGLDKIAAHHGSLSRETRLDVEDRLKRGQLKAVVSSTSLELGIDIGSIDMVCQIGSPKSIAKGLQRIGRSGHGVGETSKGKMIVFDNDDLVECAVLAKKASENFIDRVDIPRNSLDVLAQVLVGMSLEKVWDVDEAYSLVKNSYSFQSLAKEEFMAVLAYLSSRDMPHVYSKVWHDEDENVFGRKRGSRLIYYLNSGTIPEEANYKVFSDAGGRLGELSEGFVERLSQGDVFVLGGNAYEFLRSRGMNLFVKPATGRRPTVPSWTGEMLPRSFDLSVEIGKFRAIMKDLIKGGKKDIERWLRENYMLDRGGARSIASYFKEQLSFNGQIPTDRNLVLEGYIDPKGNLNVVFHYCFGRRVNDALARAYAMAVSNKHGCNVSVSVNDDSFMLTLSKRVKLAGLEKLVNPKNMVKLLGEALKDTELFKQRFRHCSTRSFMVLRNYRGVEVPVGRQQQRAHKVLRAIGSDREFPIVKETMREITSQAMNLDGALEVLAGIKSGNIKVSHAGITDVPSPFAHNAVLVGMSDIVLMHDRSAMLKELHRKVLARVGGNILKPEFEALAVEKHFEEKRPLISDKADIKTLLAEVGPLEIFSTKERSIFDFSGVKEETLAAWAGQHANSGELESIWAGRPLWCASSELDDYASLFASRENLGMPADKIIPLLKKEKSPLPVLSIAGRLEIDPKEARKGLVLLERAYLAARRGQDVKGNVLWTARTVKTREPDKNFIIKIIKRHLKYFAPLTQDELAYDLGLAKEKVSGIIAELESSGLLSSGAFTEPFLQYMLVEDRLELKGAKKGQLASLEQISDYLIKKQFSTVYNLDQYFDRFGVVWMPQELVARAGMRAYDDWLERRRSGKILNGRFMDGSVCFVRRKDAQLFVDAYRSESLSDAHKKMLALIEAEPGIDLGALERKLELPASKVKFLLETLDRNMYVVRQFVERESWSSWNRYEALGLKQRPAMKEKAARKIVLMTLKAHAPLPLDSLARATGFSIGFVSSVVREEIKAGSVVELKAADTSQRTFLVPKEEAGELMGDGPIEKPGTPQAGRRKTIPPVKKDAGLAQRPAERVDKVRILTLFDPFVQHFRFELRRRFGDAWYYPIFKGTRPVGMFEMWEMSGLIDIREIALDDVSLLPEFLDELDKFSEFYDENLMDLIRIKGAFGKAIAELDRDILRQFEAHGYGRVRDWLVKGDVIDQEVDEDQFVYYLMWRNRVVPSRRLGTIREGLAWHRGFRSDAEAALRCKAVIPLAKLHKLGIVEMGRLVPHLLTYALPDDIMLHKAALDAKPDDEMKYLVAMFEEEGPLKWREAIDKSPLGYKSTLEAKNKLTSGLWLLFSADKRYYLTDKSPYRRERARKELVKRAFDQFGIFSAEILAYYSTGLFKMTELRRILRELEDEGYLMKGFLLRGSDSLHWLVKEDVKKLKSRPEKFDAVLTFNDRLGFYLVPSLWRKFGLGSAWLFISNGKLIAAAKVWTKKGELHVTKYAGDERGWDILRQHSINVGMRVRKMLDEDKRKEEYEDWYEEPTVNSKKN